MASFRNKLVALLAIAAVTLVMAVMFFAVESEREAATLEGRRAREVSAAVQSLLQALTDVETSQRGYLLTNEQRYLDLYLSTRDAVPARLDDLARIVGDEARLAHVRELAGDKLSELEETVTLARDGQHDAAMAIVASDRGIDVMDEIRDVSAELMAVAEARRTAAQERRDAISLWTQIGVISSLLAVALLVLLVWSGIRHDIEQMDEQARVIQGQARELAIKSEGLERIASSLEEQNEALAKSNRDLEVASRQRIRAMTDLERRNRDLDQFAYVTSHDLKAPLRAISNLATWIDEDLPQGSSADTRDNLKLLRQRAARMESLIEGILTYSRAGRAGAQQKPLPKMATMGELFEEVRSFVGVPATLCDVEGGADVEVPSGALELFQTLGNLVSNAVKHAGEGKTVHLSARRADADTLEIAVRDEGPGIDPRYHDRIFEIFQTLQPRDKVESTGIGLAIVKKLVTGAGGRVWVESEVGRGATFRFTWPKAHSEA